ncbi:uncharacterized protein V1516DRAFT_669358 [Lipomyces oligophaga]|uniref:uncharacterized protein n=1 Tax=Lipomyces oligophaga TaxID=45792 RepID=UPI0034CD1EF1
MRGSSLEIRSWLLVLLLRRLVILRSILIISRKMTATDSFGSVFREGLFADKVVLCTGGSGTICSRQVALLVTLGANAAIVGRKKDAADSAAAAIKQLRAGSKVIGIAADVRSISAMNEAVDQAVKELGKIDFVICGAAGNFLADFQHLSANAFKTVVDIDLLGSFNTVKAAQAQLMQNKGVVIFVSTTLHYYGVQFQSHVGAAKAGVDALSRSLAVELGPFGVRLNCIAPGPISGTEGFNRLLPSDLREKAAKAVPLQRFGSVEDIAAATAFLFSDAASYITGTTIVVDGGAWQIGQSSLPYPDGKVFPSDLASFLLTQV